MISFVAGPVAALGPDHAVIEVGGFGVTVQCTPSTLATLRVGEHARLATSLVVREDSLTLYGFADDDGRRTFELLQTASGVGPRLAQAMLAVHTPEALRRAIAHQDQDQRLWVHDVRAGTARLVATSDTLPFRDLRWSADGRWLAYVQAGANAVSRIWLFSMPSVTGWLCFSSRLWE